MSGQTKFNLDPYFDLLDFAINDNSWPPTSPAPRLITNNTNNNNNNNNNNNFPIGTFSLDSLQSPPSSNNDRLIKNNYGNGGNNDMGMFNSQSMNLMNGLGIGNHSGGIGNSQNNNSSSFNNSGSNGTDGNHGTRETGIIEKLLHSYGFIQCCERQARLFFHFSQFGGNIEHLKIGDPVEFEMTYDKRTGKPIASQVSKIAPEVVHREERVTGTVTTEISANGNETTGRISYENRGECFFLPYTKDDVEGNVQLKAGDKVSFQIATNQRGNLGACHIRLENAIHPVKYRGVVCSMKETFGFIERADVVKEIFFHFSETEGNNMEVRPGDDVEFVIQTRNGKEVACNIARLPPGSVIFEDIDPNIMKGQVLKPLEANNPLAQPPQPPSDPLPGRIKFRAPDHSEREVPFGEKDQKGEFTLKHGDWVQFLLATDRRDQLKRATCISLLDDTFQLSGEKREQGIIMQLKEGFGFIKCVERSVRLFFHFTEVLDTSREITVGDEIEFTCVQDPTSSFNNPRLSAIRIKHLPEGTVKFETLIESNVEGIVTREAPKSPTKSQERTEGGCITYGIGNNKKTLMYFLKDCEKSPRVGENVRFNICQVKRNKELIATNIQEIFSPFQITQVFQPIDLQKLFMNSPNCIVPVSPIHQMNPAPPSPPPQLLNNEIPQINNGIVNPALLNGSSTIVTSTNINVTYLSGAANKTYDAEKFKMHQGFIAVLKDNFGFIETLEHDQEVFFHFSNFIGNTNHLELGQEVEYSLSARNGLSGGNCIPAEHVRLLPRGTIVHPKILDGTYNGLVVRPLRCINPDQEEYSGLIQLKGDNGECISQHKFGITSLTNKRDLLQKDDIVVFKIDETSRAVDVTAVRQKKRAFVDSIKGQFGFLDYEVEEGKKLFFHMTEVQGNSFNLYPGDTVEFSIITNHRTGKTSACGVIKVVDSSPRPERLISRLKINSVDENAPRLTIIRAPKGPDTTNGFSSDARLPRIAGVFVE